MFSLMGKGQSLSQLALTVPFTQGSRKGLLSNRIENMTEKETAEWVRRLWKAGKSFYKTYAWVSFRARVMKKKKYRCELCWNGGIDGKGVRKYKRAVVLHHKKHLKDCPDLALTESNMEALCEDCHKLRHPEVYERGGDHKERWD